MEDFVSFELANKLKEKMFRGKCEWHYYDDTKDSYRSSVPQCYNYGGNTSDAPTISQVLKWLREEKNTHVDIDVYFYGWFFNVTSFHKIDTDMYECDFLYISDITTPKYDTYEQAALAGIEYVLDNLIIT